MTSKKALECLTINFRWDDKEEIKAYEVLEQLVRRDTPMKPLLVENKYHYDCSHCNSNISIGLSKSYNKVFNVFCRVCGQRLDWGE